MGMFDEVLCNHKLFGVHRGETQQTKDLHWLGGLLDNYEITPSGRLEFLEYTVEDRSDPTLEGIERLFGMMTRIFTGGRRDMNYHGWLYLSCFGRAKFTDGTLVAFEPEPDQPSGSEQPDEAHKAAQAGERSGAECDPVPESRMEQSVDRRRLLLARGSEARNCQACTTWTLSLTSVRPTCAQNWHGASTSRWASTQMRSANCWMTGRLQRNGRGSSENPNELESFRMRIPVEPRLRLVRPRV